VRLTNLRGQIRGCSGFLSEPASYDEAMMSDDCGGPPAHPLLNRAGLVAGIGLRASASADDLLSLLDACLMAASASRADLVALATLRARAGHSAIAAVAKMFDIPVVGLPTHDLHTDVPNPSQRVAGLAGVPSVAEGSALAFGPLVLSKQRSANLTCALARYTPTDRFSASSASSTLATSSAGP
jgi:cobalt-precorrin 5A hydrolase